MKIATNSIIPSTPTLRKKSRDFYPPPGAEPIKDKTEWIKNYFAEIGFTDEVFEENMRRIKSQLPPPQPSKEESEEADFNYVWSLVEEVEERNHTIRQLQTDLAEKDKLIASLQEQLKQAGQKQPA